MRPICEFARSPIATDQAQNQFGALEQQFQSNPANVQLGVQLAGAYIQLQRTDAAVAILDRSPAARRRRRRRCKSPILTPNWASGRT